MSIKPIYLDNCATTRMDNRVLDAMLPYFQEEYGNASSHSHVYGWAADEAVVVAREEIATLISAAPREIVITSGATESNNLAITGFARANRHRGNHLITCVTEHKSVLDTCKALEAEGFEVTRLPVDSAGRISLNTIRREITSRTILVSLMIANNETGTIHPIAEVARLCRPGRIALHADGTQLVGKLPTDVGRLGVDLLSFSAHKLHGPKGIGALYVSSQSGIKMEAIVHGGGHQQGLRSGTLPVPLVVGFGTACRIARHELEDDGATRTVERSLNLENKRDRLEQAILAELPETIINGDRRNRSPIVTNLSFPGVESEALLLQLDSVAASAGSACTSASGQPSYVLAAMGLDARLSGACLRLSVSKFTTEHELDTAAHAVISVVRTLRGEHTSDVGPRDEFFVSSRVELVD